ncbi:C-C motif chemokine 4-like [Ciconia boyciana]|uniref:C-C motif chemokine 4-like n=1 Tax=Ciconia boyciana TaxID=52775 RepID=UPI003B9E3285
MKVPAVALATLLLIAICSPAEAHRRDSGVAAPSQKTDIVPRPCCFTYALHRIPRSLISSAYKTSSGCSQPAVVVVTKKGRNICVNPQEPWVQALLKDFAALTPVQRA